MGLSEPILQGVLKMGESLPVVTPRIAAHRSCLYSALAASKVTFRSSVAMLCLRCRLQSADSDSAPLAADRPVWP